MGCLENIKRFLKKYVKEWCHKEKKFKSMGEAFYNFMLLQNYTIHLFYTYIHMNMNLYTIY